MTARDALVDKAARAIFGQDHLHTDLRSCREDAQVVLDAILPQVSTVAELKALPKGSVLLDPEWGVPYELTAFGWMSPGEDSAESLDADDFPLTVVWQPEVTA